MKIMKVKKKRFQIVLLLMFAFAYASAQQQFTVFFDSNKYVLNSLEQKKIELWISENGTVKIIGANGFCDEDGSQLANDTLAKKRINHVYDFVKGKIAVRSDFKAHSFGELHKLSKNKAENRKVTLFYLKKEDFARENEILGIKPMSIKTIDRPKINFANKQMIQNPDGSVQEMLLDTVFMQRINLAKKGEVLAIKNLNFLINTFIIVAQSRPKLYELLMVMQKNPTLMIQIQGHLCCNADDKKDLSGLRAKAVMQFLVNNEIDKSRISFVGFGGTKPIYSIPEKSEEERAANRRVEIMVVYN